MRCEHCGQEIVKREPVKTVADLNGSFVEPKVIKETILAFFQERYSYLTMEDIIRRDRTYPLTYARHLMLVFMRKKTSLPIKAIGKELGRDHTTVIHAVGTIDNLMFSDPQVLQDVRIINDRLKEKIA